MRIKLQTPSGSSIITLPAGATVGDLHSSISERASHQNFEIKSGFPPKPLRLHALPRSKPLVELDERLDGGQLLVSPSDDQGDHTTGGGGGGGDVADIKAP